MANTNPISQMIQQQRTSAGGQSSSATPKEGDRFEDVLNQTTETAGKDRPETKEEPKAEVVDGSQDNTEEVDKSEHQLPGHISAFLIQSMVGKSLVNQEPVAPVVNTTITEEVVAPTVIATLDTADGLLQEPSVASKSNELVKGTLEVSLTEQKTQTLAQPKVGEGQQGEATLLPADSVQTTPSQELETTQALSGNQERPLLETGEKMVLQTEVSNKEEVKLDETAMTTLQSKETPVEQPEVIRIKVAEPFRQVDQNMMNQISGNIKDQAVLGREEMIIQLEPEHLGKIAIKISMEDHGIKVILNCENARTQALLADKAAGIGRIVEDNLQRPVTVETKDDGYWNQQKDATDQHKNQNSRQQEQTQSQSAEDTDLFVQQLRLGLAPQMFAS